MYLYDIKKKTVTKVPCDEDSFEGYDIKTTLYMFEPDLSYIQPFSTDIPTVITVSPNSIRYHEFLKQKGAGKLYMPVWTFEELLEAREFFPNAPTEKEVTERFNEFGGIFRYIFPTSHDVIREARQKRMQAINDLNLQKLLATGNIEDISLSHLIAQYQNIPLKDNKAEHIEAFTSFTLDLVSDELQIELRKRLHAVANFEKITTLIKNDQTGFMNKLC